jgi:hypothetical protein
MLNNFINQLIIVLELINLRRFYEELIVLLCLCYYPLKPTRITKIEDL